MCNELCDCVICFSPFRRWPSEVVYKFVQHNCHCDLQYQHDKYTHVDPKLSISIPAILLHVKTFIEEYHDPSNYIYTIPLQYHHI